MCLMPPPTPPLSLVSCCLGYSCALCTLGIFCLLSEIACLAQLWQHLTICLGTDILLWEKFSVLLLLETYEATGVFCIAMSKPTVILIVDFVMWWQVLRRGMRFWSLTFGTPKIALGLDLLLTLSNINWVKPNQSDIVTCRS